MNNYQGYFADCFVLTNKRTEAFVEEFLNRFVPKRRESEDEYEVPQYEKNPVESIKSVKEKVKFLVENKSIKHSLYWENPIKSELKGAELFFTDDGHIILGIYCETKFPNTEIEDKIFKEIKAFCKSNEGYIAYEDSPPHNSVEFRKIIEKQQADT